MPVCSTLCKFSGVGFRMILDGNMSGSAFPTIANQIIPARQKSSKWAGYKNLDIAGNGIVLFILSFSFIMYKSGLAVLVLAALSSVQAHYQLTYPQSRGFVEDSEPLAPCGGFNTVNTTRTEFPIKNGFLEINSEHVQYQYTVNLALKSNPGAADFSSQNATVANGTNSFPDQACLPVDLSKVNGAVDGTPATLQIVYNAGDSLLYQVKYHGPYTTF